MTNETTGAMGTEGLPVPPTPSRAIPSRSSTCRSARDWPAYAGAPFRRCRPGAPVALRRGADLPGRAWKKPRRRKKAILLLVLLGLLAMLATLVSWYLIFRQPIPLPIPVIPNGGLPAYTTSIYGANGPMGIAVSPDGDRIYVADTEGDPGSPGLRRGAATS